MGRKGIGATDVIETIHQLKGQNKKPTIDNIAALLGRGSRSTINEHLKAWKQANPENPQMHNDDTPHELLSLTKGLWQRTQELAKEQIETYQAEANQKIQTAEQRFIESERAQNAQQMQLKELEEIYKKAQEDIESLQAKLQSLSLEKTQWQEKAVGFERQVIEQAQEKEKLHALAHNLQTNLEHFHAETQKWKTEQAMLLDKERQQAAQKIKLLEGQLNAEIQQKLVLEQQHQQTHAVLIQTQHEVVSIGKNHGILLEQLNQLKADYQSSQEKQQLLMQQSQIRENEWKEQLKQVGQLEAENVGLKNHLSQYEKMHQKIEDKLQKLTDEKLFLSQEKFELLSQLKAMKV